MPSIMSYFNPFSNAHHATTDFAKLSVPKKLQVIGTTFLISVFTLGIGTVAGFRLSTKKFSTDMQGQLGRTAKKADGTAHDTFNSAGQGGSGGLSRTEVGDLLDRLDRLNADYSGSKRPTLTTKEANEIWEEAAKPEPESNKVREKILKLPNDKLDKLVAMKPPNIELDEGFMTKLRGAAGLNADLL